MLRNKNALEQALALNRRLQRLYDRYDLLSEASYNLRWAVDALSRCRDAAREDSLSALEQIAQEVVRDRDDLQSQLERLEDLEVVQQR